jgi:hypothetical protein
MTVEGPRGSGDMPAFGKQDPRVGRRNSKAAKYDTMYVGPGQGCISPQMIEEVADLGLTPSTWLLLCKMHVPHPRDCLVDGNLQFERSQHPQSVFSRASCYCSGAYELQGPPGVGQGPAPRTGGRPLPSIVRPIFIG